ncbi:hypothetical protein G6F31_018676 [Rhizopus arrhizus]|nr:hypothetical protein G6F31_018676 [Rhizopus arrhizus]
MLGPYPIPEANQVENLVGRGITARVGEQQVWIGKVEMFGTPGIPELGSQAIAWANELREDGRTTMVVKLGDRDLGAIGLMDTPRQGARETIEELRRLGISHMVMISGDKVKVAKAISTEVGIEDARVSNRDGW